MSFTLFTLSVEYSAMPLNICLYSKDASAYDRLYSVLFGTLSMYSVSVGVPRTEYSVQSQRLGTEGWRG